MFFFLLQPLLLAAQSFKSPSMSSMGGREGGGAKRIKLVKTKQQLHELLAKQLSVQDVLSWYQRKALAHIGNLSSNPFLKKTSSNPRTRSNIQTIFYCSLSSLDFPIVLLVSVTSMDIEVSRSYNGNGNGNRSMNKNYKAG